MLTTEDEFRLNVLLASSPRAIRIDESSMSLHALDSSGTEQLIKLTSNTRDDVYLRAIRNLLADKAGFPGGYPAALRRWSAMGQSQGGSLHRMLLLGENEAVTAVSTSRDVTENLAELAWWALPEAENARQLLAHSAVTKCSLARRLCNYLIEYLPFETDYGAITSTVTKVLATSLISDTHRETWWRKSQKSCAYMLGFLRATPDSLPQIDDCHPLYETHRANLETLHTAGNAIAGRLLTVLSAPGQSYIHACRLALARTEDQNMVISLIDSIADYFIDARPENVTTGLHDTIESQSHRLGDTCQDSINQLIGSVPGLRCHSRSIVTLSLISSEIVQPVLSKTTATGSLMRRKLSPVTDRLDAELARLLPKDH